MSERQSPFRPGQYFVVFPSVLSVFRINDGRQRKYIRRNWPFLVTETTPAGFEAHNTTTQHNLTVSRDEIVTWRGDSKNPPNYHRPLILHLNRQIYWDGNSLWRGQLLPPNRIMGHDSRGMHRVA